MEMGEGEDVTLSHWEQSWIGSEMMGPQIFKNTAYISRLTLTYFLDSGWYIPNMEQVADLIFLNTNGCGFFNGGACTSGPFWCDTDPE